jgi:hypothetical protein
MKKGLRKKRRVIITAIFAMGIITTITYLIVSLQLQNIRRQSFVESFESLVQSAYADTKLPKRGWKVAGKAI